MPHRRRVEKGSFASHFDELVPQFPAGEARPSSSGDSTTKRSARLQDKIDVHALLFERAWQLDPKR